MQKSPKKIVFKKSEEPVTKLCNNQKQKLKNESNKVAV